MFFALILFFCLGAVVADMWHYRRRVRHAGRGFRAAFIGWAALTDLLPFMAGIGSLFLHDNDTLFMTFAQWSLYAWMLTVLPRMVFYVFSLLRLRRIGFALLFVWGATRGRTRIVVNRVAICSGRIPAAFDGFRIAQISDLHVGNLVCPERELGRIVDSIGALRPDLVLFTGDLVNIRASELDGRIRKILSRLQAPEGVWSVTGNHDIGSYIRDTTALPPATSLAQLLAAQRSMGWRILDDTTVYLRRGSDSLSLSGISFDPALRDLRHDPSLPPANLTAAYREVPDSLFNITAVHLPQLWEQVTAAGYGDLTLSGHVHSMQLKIRLFGRAYSPAQWLYDRWSGRYDEGGRTLYINDGTGYVGYPMRLGAYPEITLFTLKRCE